MVSFDDWAEQTTGNLWKANRAAVAVAPFRTSAPLTKTDVFDVTGAAAQLKALPTGWLQLGLMTEDLLSWGREVEFSEVRSGGVSDPTRRDVQSSSKSLTATVQETNRATLSLIKGMDLSAAEADNKGILEITEPDFPAEVYWRLVAVGLDLAGAAGPRFRVRHLTRVTIESGDEPWNNQENAQEVELTFSATKDSAAGFSSKEWFAFSSAAEVLAAGFTNAT